MGVESLNHQDDNAENTKESRGGSFDSLITPLPLSFEAKMGSTEFKSDFNGPSFDKIGNDGGGRLMNISREEGPGIMFAAGVTNQNPSNVDRWGASGIPKSGSGGPVNDF
jgi:hypothetical protein